jgi:amino acid adenylation domain-containing protein
MRPTCDTVGLTPMQEGMLLLAEYDGAADRLWLGQMTVVLRGALDVGAFEGAWALVVARHEALRTAFARGAGDRFEQVVHAHVEVPVVAIDLRGAPEADRESRLRALMAEDRATPFQLDRPPLMRIHLVRLGDDEHVLAWTRHHAIMDGWSASIVLGEVVTCYEAERYGVDPDLPDARQYRDYLDWLAGRDDEPSAQFWRRRLEGFRRPTPLVSSRPLDRWESPRHALEEHKTSLGEELSAGARDFALAHQLTQATVLAGAWALLVSRYTGCADVTFGLTTSGRPAEVPGVDTIVGLFLNTIPARVRIDGRQPVAAWLAELQATLAESREHDHAPLAVIRSVAELPADDVLFDHILVLEGYPRASSDEETAVGELELDGYQFIDQTNYALNVGVTPGDRSELLVVFDPDRVDPSFVERLAGHYRTLLAGIVAGATVLDDVPLLPRSERALVLDAWNATETVWSPDEDVVAGLRRQAQQTPDEVALVFGAEQISYRRLDGLVAAMAGRLAARGVGPDRVVALCFERSVELVVSMLATLRAGGAFVALDPDEPAERLAGMVRDADVAAVLASPTAAAVVVGIDADTITVDASQLAEPAVETAPPPAAVHPRAAAYVIYTSGSTGQPKGCVNDHSALSNRLQWMQSAYPIGPGDRVLQKTPCTFDVSVWEFLWPLTTGAALVLAEPGGHRDPGYVRDVIRRHGITVVHFVPSFLRAFVSLDGIEECTSLRHVIASGERLTPDLRDQCRARLPGCLHNLYGPSEAAIDVSAHSLDPTQTGPIVPIGRPIANTRLYVLDAALQPVPIGVAGEIFIGGRAVGRGYAGRPALTAERFCPDPHAGVDGARMYRTGDLGRWDEDGRLVHVGRLDNQVKVRGVRIELEEVESALLAHPQVEEAAVHPDLREEGDSRLVAHVTVRANPTAELSDSIRQHVRARLPPAMVPGGVVFHDGLPRLPNGKLHRRELAGSAGRHAPAAAFVAPRTPVESEIAEIWQAVLGLPVVGVNQNFFELGGHSLLLSRVGPRLEEAFGVRLPLRVLFDASTIEQITEVLLDALLAETR